MTIAELRQKLTELEREWKLHPTEEQVTVVQHGKRESVGVEVVDVVIAGGGAAGTWIRLELGNPL